MFAVFSEREIAYLGDSQDEAVATLELKDPSFMHVVSDLGDLAQKFQNHLNGITEVENPDDLNEAADEYFHDLNLEGEEDSTSSNSFSEALRKVFDELDKVGINSENAEELAGKVRDKGEEIAIKVRSLGIESMKCIGKGFVALGEVLNEASEEVTADSSIDESLREATRQPEVDPVRHEPVRRTDDVSPNNGTGEE